LFGSDREANEHGNALCSNHVQGILYLITMMGKKANCAIKLISKID
jgi:hypothetical protein